MSTQLLRLIRPHKLLSATNVTRFNSSAASSSSIKQYSERRLIGYKPEQLFDVVARVEDYYQFVPACRKSHVLQRTDTFVKANLEIGMPPILESYTSHVTLDRPNFIAARCTDGVLFNHLDTNWKFSPGPNNQQDICLLEFYVSFEFRSLLYSKLAYLVFDEMVRLNVNAFLKRAAQLYGPQRKISPSLHRSPT